MITLKNNKENTWLFRTLVVLIGFSMFLVVFKSEITINNKIIHERIKYIAKSVQNIIYSGK